MNARATTPGRETYAEFTTLDTRWLDNDVYGHVNNVQYYSFFDTAVNRWLIEKGFGWLKQTGALRQVKLRGLAKVDWLFVFGCAAHNLLRLPKLMAQPTAAGFMSQCV